MRTCVKGVLGHALCLCVVNYLYIIGGYQERSANNRTTAEYFLILTKEMYGS